MNNFGSENMGVLLHKLTKYQTLLSNCGAPAKSAVYNQKIGYYSHKLNGMGVSQNNLKSMRNLIGGGLTAAEFEALRDSIDQIVVAGPKDDVPEKDDFVENIEAKFDQIMTQHAANKLIVENLKKEKIEADANITKLTLQNTEHNKQIAEHAETIQKHTTTIQQNDIKIADQFTEINAKAESIRTHIAEIYKNNTDMAALNAKITQLEADIEGHVTMIDKLAQLVKDARQKCEAKPASRPVNQEAADKKAAILLKLERADMKVD